VGGADPIPDSHMTASSFRSISTGPSFARLGGTSGAWCPSQEEKIATVPNFYLQVSSITFDMGLFVICFSILTASSYHGGYFKLSALLGLSLLLCLFGKRLFVPKGKC